MTWENMSVREQLMSYVTSETIGTDAWEDHFLDEAVKLAAKLPAGALLAEVQRLQGRPRLRLLQVLLDIEQPELVPELLAMLRQPPGDDEAQLLIDYLRTWTLSEPARSELRALADAHRGKSQLLDRVISTI